MESLLKRKTFKLPETIIQKPQNFFQEPSEKRLDGRKPAEMRSLHVRAGLVEVARGSAYFELKNTKVLCTVYGPKNIIHEFIDNGRLNCDVQFVTFSNREFQEDLPKDFSKHLKKALEISVILDKFPKSEIEVRCLVIQNDGNALSAAISCASLALADAGIELYSMVSSCSCCLLLDKQGRRRLVLDPTFLEEKYGIGVVIMSAMATTVVEQQSLQVSGKRLEIVHFIQIGSLNAEELSEGLLLCQAGCQNLLDIMAKEERNSIIQRTELTTDVQDNK